ncbi:hypothetical protein J2T55_002635 [Methylohalomonas lacus]|uniref:Uncharacterized protein n=1 Tax=Methylohalomonas lacus TaxID=398773 RepID=A0AAE3HMH9_9GAMM|nr:hypothetical protein [Methylohalomonas lacus]
MLASLNFLKVPPSSNDQPYGIFDLYPKQLDNLLILKIALSDQAITR